MSNSPSHSQLNTRKIWKENLVIYQKSLKAFLPGTPAIIVVRAHCISWEFDIKEIDKVKFLP